MAKAATNWENRREHTRVVLKTSVHMASESNFYTGFTDNISEGGIFIATYNHAPLGTKLTLEFSLPDEGPPIRVEGEVRWLREFNPSSEVSPGMGFRFCDIDDESKNRVENFCRGRDTLFYDED
jgi:uncharacterized protein (TIGR02266 family)